MNQTRTKLLMKLMRTDDIKSEKPILNLLANSGQLGKVTGYKGSIPDRTEDFSSHHFIQTGSGPHKASYPMCPGGSSVEGKAANV